MINTALLPEASNTKTTTLLSLLLKGGWIMVPILLLSILTVYAIIERLIVLYKTAKVPQQWMDQINTTTLAGDVHSVKLLCEQKDYAVARIIRAGIEKLCEPIKTVETAIESTGQMEIYKLERNLSLLGTIAGAAPMLGFLGTVMGMIQAFMSMAQEARHISPQLLSGGIYEAMITTAAGLVVGIVANLGYNYLLTRIQKATHRIEYASNQFIKLIQSLPKAKQHSKVHEA